MNLSEQVVRLSLRCVMYCYIACKQGQPDNLFANMRYVRIAYIFSPAVYGHQGL